MLAVVAEKGRRKVPLKKVKKTEVVSEVELTLRKLWCIFCCSECLEHRVIQKTFRNSVFNVAWFVYFYRKNDDEIAKVGTDNPL